ncbi:MAG TPA: type IV pilus biogenesis/stability protein PilW [Chromatiales bacterium]|nr:type IV pilus biogenesis/stability protein PilW [Chromatiales bacterium]
MKTLIVTAMLTLVVLLGGCATASDTPENLRKASSYNTELGLGYMRQGKFDVALKKLQTALKQDPYNGEAHQYIAVLYQTLGERNKAGEHYAQALELMPDHVVLKNNYGVYLCSTGRYDESRKYFREALSDPLYKNKPQVYENIGICALEQGNVRLAEENFQNALAMAPRSAKSLLGMAGLKFDEGKFRAARDYLYQYLQVAPQTPASLWLGILLAKQAGNENRIASYSILLKGKFPRSEEAAKLKRMEAAGKI